ncbi:MAG: hypothetical protein P4N41_21355 [Negativicutes bacterium]|nr:hypothetical protein [Negativicutes bacterium]
MTNTNNQSQGQSANDQSIINSYSTALGPGQPAATSGQQAQLSDQAGSSAGSAAMKTVIGVFSSQKDAEQAVNRLRQQGFSNEEINIVSKKQGGKQYVDDDISDGALTGGTLGGIGGLILGAGALAIPGVGPIIAAGPIAAALSGAVAGGLAGGLIDWGIPAEVSRHYEQEVASGSILAVIRTNRQKVDQAAQILRQAGAKDVESHAADKS